MFRPITTVAGIVSVTAVLVISSGRLPGQEVIRLEGQPLSVTPVFDRENRPQSFVGEPPAGILTVGGDTVVTCVAYSPDGQTLAVGDGPNRPICTLGAPPLVLCLSYSRDGRRLAAGRRDSTIRIREAARADAPPSATLKHGHYVAALAFSPDGKSLAACDWSRQIIVWNANTGRELGRIESSTDWFTSLAFSPDAQSLAAGNRDTSISVFAFERVFRLTR